MLGGGSVLKSSSVADAIDLRAFAAAGLIRARHLASSVLKSSYLAASCTVISSFVLGYWWNSSRLSGQSSETSPRRGCVSALRR
jgi:hypothetical protein